MKEANHEETIVTHQDKGESSSTQHFPDKCDLQPRMLEK